MNLIQSTFPVLHTSRLKLRQLTLNDAPQVHRLRSDPGINRYIGRAASQNLDDAIAHIGKIDTLFASNKGLYWVITLNGDDKLIGTVCFWNYDPGKETIETGYELMTAHQHQGIMAEAVKAVINYGFEQMQAKAITAFVTADNMASISLLDKSGFVIDNDLSAGEADNGHDMLGYKLSHG